MHEFIDWWERKNLTKSAIQSDMKVDDMYWQDGIRYKVIDVEFREDPVYGKIPSFTGIKIEDEKYHRELGER